MDYFLLIIDNTNNKRYFFNFLVSFLDEKKNKLCSHYSSRTII